MPLALNKVIEVFFFLAVQIEIMIHKHNLPLIGIYTIGMYQNGFIELK